MNFEELAIFLLSPELIATLGFSAGAATLALALILIRLDTHLVLDRTDLLLIGCVLILVGIDYLLISAGQSETRSVAFSRIAWAAIFVGGLSLSLKYLAKIYRESSARLAHRNIG